MRWREGDIDDVGDDNNKEEQSGLGKTCGDEDLVSNESKIKIRLECGIEP